MQIYFKIFILIFSLLIDERPYACDQCNKSFKDKSLVIRHKKTHGKDRPFSCAHCSRVFLSKSELRRHLTVHSGILYIILLNNKL